MQSEEVSALCAKFKNNLMPEAMETFESRLTDAGEDACLALDGVCLKDRKTALLLSIFLGVWAAGRFYLGDIRGGVFKLIVTTMVNAFCVALAVAWSPLILLLSGVVLLIWCGLDIAQVKAKTVSVNTTILFDAVYDIYAPSAFGTEAEWGEFSEIYEAYLRPPVSPVSDAWKRRADYSETVFRAKPAICAKPTNGFSVAGFFLSFFSGLFGLIFSIIGLVKAKRAKEGTGFAIAGIAISCAWFAIAAVSVGVVLSLVL